MNTAGEVEHVRFSREQISLEILRDSEIFDYNYWIALRHINFFSQMHWLVDFQSIEIDFSDKK